MTRLGVGFTVLAVLLVSHLTSAQGRTPAGPHRVEVGVAPVGGTFFTKGAADANSSFSDYTMGISGAVNLWKGLAAEAEFAGGLGTKSIDFNRHLPIYSGEGPNTIAFTGNAIYHLGQVRGWNLVPYAAAGLGSLSLRSRNELAATNLVTRNETFITENVGGGLKWFVGDHVGLRGDYRYVIVNGKDSAEPFFGLNDTRYGHRVFGSVVYRFGR